LSSFHRRPHRVFARAESETSPLSSWRLPARAPGTRRATRNKAENGEPSLRPIAPAACPQNSSRPRQAYAKIDHRLRMRTSNPARSAPHERTVFVEMGSDSSYQENGFGHTPLPKHVLRENHIAELEIISASRGLPVEKRTGHGSSTHRGAGLGRVVIDEIDGHGRGALPCYSTIGFFTSSLSRTRQKDRRHRQPARRTPGVRFSLVPPRMRLSTTDCHLSHF